MPKHGNWGNWATIGSRHAYEPGVERWTPDHYDKTAEQRRKETAAILEKKKYALPWENDSYNPLERHDKHKTKNKKSKKATILNHKGEKTNCKYHIKQKGVGFSSFCIVGQLCCENCKKYRYVKGKSQLDSLIKGDCHYIELIISNGKKEYICSLKKMII